MAPFRGAFCSVLLWRSFGGADTLNGNDGDNAMEVAADGTPQTFVVEGEPRRIGNDGPIAKVVTADGGTEAENMPVASGKPSIRAHDSGQDVTGIFMQDGAEDEALMRAHAHTGTFESARDLLYSPYRRVLGDMFETVNGKTKLLKRESEEQCESQAKNFMEFASSAQTTDSRRTPRLIHTGMFFEAGGGTAKWQNAASKIRLGVLSILASQDLRDTKIHFWADVDPDNTLLQESLGQILARDDFAQIISVKKFDPDAEFAKMPTQNGNFLEQIYTQNDMMLPKSDLSRAAILYNYGGMWVDTDALMIHDISPLVDMDWAYLGQEGLINNAVLSVSKPKSPFIAAYLKKIATDYSFNAATADNIYKFGATLLNELHEDPIDSSSFYILPACFFDGAWPFFPALTPAATSSVPWEDFFRRPATDDEIKYITPNDPSNTAFIYHWHGRWDQQSVDGSLAAKAEQMYSDMLQLSPSLHRSFSPAASLPQ